MSKGMEMFSILLVLLCYASTFFLPSHATTFPPSVIDIYGQSLRPGQKYYILPFIHGTGGGLAIRQRDDLCPLYVVQAALEVDPGRPMTFIPMNPDDDVIRISTDLNVHVSAITTCMQSNVWRLDEQTGHRYVAINGIKGNPGKETLSSWFKIEKYEKMDDIYKLVYCPTVCDKCRPMCGDLGVFIEGERRWLGITVDNPFPVQFKPVPETTKEIM